MGPLRRGSPLGLAPGSPVRLRVAPSFQITGGARWTRRLYTCSGRGSIPRTSNMYDEHILYCIMRARQEGLSVFARFFSSSFSAASRSRCVTHDERDCPANCDACSNSLLTSGKTRTCNTFRFAKFNLGLPLFAIHKVYCKKISKSSIFLLTTPLKCSTIIQVVVSEG